MRRAFQEGHDAEPRIIRRLKEEYGVEFYSLQVEGELILPDNVVVRFHPDGIGILNPETFEELIGSDVYAVDRFVVEIKNLSNDLWQRATRYGIESTFEEYPWQLSSMMIATRFPGLWVARNKGYPPNKDTGVKPPCEDEDRLWFQFVHEPLITIDQIREKARLIKEGVLGEDISTSDRVCETPDHWPCRFLHIRPEPEGQEQEVGIQGSTFEVDSETEDGHLLDEDIREYIYCKGQVDELTKRRDAARDRILARAGDESKKILTSKWIVPVVNGRGASKLDWASMSEELKKVVKKYQRPGKAYRYLKDITRRD
jgi:hypothetical protein